VSDLMGRARGVWGDRRAVQGGPPDVGLRRTGVRWAERNATSG